MNDLRNNRNNRNKTRNKSNVNKNSKKNELYLIREYLYSLQRPFYPPSDNFDKIDEKVLELYRRKQYESLTFKRLRRANNESQQSNKISSEWKIVINGMMSLFNGTGVEKDGRFFSMSANRSQNSNLMMMEKMKNSGLFDPAKVFSHQSAMPGLDNKIFYDRGKGNNMNLLSKITERICDNFSVIPSSQPDPLPKSKFIIKLENQFYENLNYLSRHLMLNRSILYFSPNEKGEHIEFVPINLDNKKINYGVLSKIKFTMPKYILERPGIAGYDHFLESQINY